MSEFSATDAGLVGFGLARQNPRTILAWAVLAFVGVLVTYTLMTVLSGPALSEARNFTPGAEPSLAEVLALYRGMLPGYGASIAVSLVTTGLLAASAARLVLNPADHGGFGYMKLGPDEFRQVLLALVLNLIYFGLWGAVGALSYLGYLVGGIGLASLVGLLAFLAAIGGSIFLAVRLSLASSATFVRQRLALRESWQLTAGRFWPLFGTYLLAGVLGFLVILLVVGLAMVVITLAFGFAAAGGAMSPSFESVGALFTLPSLIYFAVLAFGSALGYLIFFCPAPTIYKQLTGSPAVFD